MSMCAGADGGRGVGGGKERERGGLSLSLSLFVWVCVCALWMSTRFDRPSRQTDRQTVRVLEGWEDGTGQTGHS